MQSSSVDLIIIGGGPIGICCALEAAERGVDYLVLEKGCLVNSLYHYPLNMTFFSTSERLEIGGIPFMSVNNKPTRPEALEYYRRVAVSRNIKIRLQEKALSIKQMPYGFLVQSSKGNYACRKIIIATGFYDIPVMMNIPGENLPKLTHYYRDAHFYAMQKVVVVGANNSAVDAALETFRKGAEVTIVSRGPGIGERVKYWVRPDIENRIGEGAIKAWFNSTLTAVRTTEVDIITPQGLITIPNDYIIAMTGYQPDFDFLEKAGITLDRNNCLQPVYNPETMETNIAGIYLAGVVCGGLNTHQWFIENSREHALKILTDITRREL